MNITEKPLQSFDSPLVQADDSQFVDSPYKVYVGNLAKTVTTDTLKSFFAEKGKVLSAKVSRVPGTSKSTGYGFVTFSSEEDVEAAITSLNNVVRFSYQILSAWNDGNPLVTSDETSFVHFTSVIILGGSRSSLQFTSK